MNSLCLNITSNIEDCRNFYSGSSAEVDKKKMMLAGNKCFIPVIVR